MHLESGYVNTPFLITIYGRPGVGKSTLASFAPSPFFIDLESGTRKIQCERIVGIKKLDDFDKALSAIESNKIAANSSTIVIDTIDFLEQLVFESICEKHIKTSIGDFGYGKGYEYSTDAIVKILNKIDKIRHETNKNFILIAHDEIKRFENPTTEIYDQYTIKLNKRTANFVFAKCDAVLYMSRPITVTKDENTEKRKIAKTTSNERIIQTEETAAIVAKNRFGLPKTLTIGNDIEKIKSLFNLFQ